MTPRHDSPASGWPLSRFRQKTSQFSYLQRRGWRALRLPSEIASEADWKAVGGLLALVVARLSSVRDHAFEHLCEIHCWIVRSRPSGAAIL